MADLQEMDRSSRILASNPKRKLYSLDKNQLNYLRWKDSASVKQPSINFGISNFSVHNVTKGNKKLSVRSYKGAPCLRTRSWTCTGGRRFAHFIPHRHLQIPPPSEGVSFTSVSPLAVSPTHSGEVNIVPQSPLPVIKRPLVESHTEEVSLCQMTSSMEGLQLCSELKPSRYEPSSFDLFQMNSEVNVNVDGATTSKNINRMSEQSNILKSGTLSVGDCVRKSYTGVGTSISIVPTSSSYDSAKYTSYQSAELVPSCDAKNSFENAIISIRDNKNIETFLTTKCSACLLSNETSTGPPDAARERETLTKALTGSTQNKKLRRRVSFDIPPSASNSHKRSGRMSVPQTKLEKNELLPPRPKNKPKILRKYSSAGLIISNESMKKIGVFDCREVNNDAEVLSAAINKYPPTSSLAVKPKKIVPLKKSSSFSAQTLPFKTDEAGGHRRGPIRCKDVGKHAPTQSSLEAAIRKAQLIVAHSEQQESNTVCGPETSEKRISKTGPFRRCNSFCVEKEKKHRKLTKARSFTLAKPLKSALKKSGSADFEKVFGEKRRVTFSFPGSEVEDNERCTEDRSEPSHNPQIFY